MGDTTNLGDMLEFTPIELDEATVQVFRDVAGMREKILHIVSQQMAIPFRLIVSPDKCENTRQTLRLTTQTGWGELVMSHALPPKEQNE